jgi:1,4-dihydroxy-2-naphthoate octaprenyltransferase
MTYILGAGVARYLGHKIDFIILGLGLIISLSLLGAAFFLTEYFRLPLVPLREDETQRQREQLRVTLVQVSYAALTLSVTAVISLIYIKALSPEMILIIIMAYLSVIIYAVPPMRFSESGYGELILALFLGTILPVMGFLLQYRSAHRLLTYISFPLTLLALAFLLIRDFPTFATDLKFSRRTLLTRLSWQYGIPIHHVLIFLTFLLFSLAPLLNIPWRIIWPVFLALPFAILQVFWLQRIANGGRTLWTFLNALSIVSFGLSIYLLALTFWIR